MRSVVLVCLLVACAAKPSAMSVCTKLGAAGVATECKSESPSGLGAAARERVVFNIPGGATGQVLAFDKSSDYDATVKAFDAAATLAGRHRYGSASALVFVQLNAETAQSLGTNAKLVVEEL
jgi:hypothetical protein